MTIIENKGLRLRGDDKSLIERYLVHDPRPGAAVYDAPGWQTRMMVGGIGYLTSEGWTTREVSLGVGVKKEFAAAMREIARDCGYAWARAYNTPRGGMLTRRWDRITDLLILQRARILRSLGVIDQRAPMGESMAGVLGANALYRLLQIGWAEVELSQDFDIPFNAMNHLLEIVSRNINPKPFVRGEKIDHW